VRGRHSFDGAGSGTVTYYKERYLPFPLLVVHAAAGLQRAGRRLLQLQRNVLCIAKAVEGKHVRLESEQTRGMCTLPTCNVNDRRVTKHSFLNFPPSM